MCIDTSSHFSSCLPFQKVYFLISLIINAVNASTNGLTEKVDAYV